MTTYILNRLIQGIIVILAVSLICFVIFRFMGDPVLSLAGRYATIEEREIVKKAFGLDKPMYVQYGRFIINAAHGNFGKSYVSRTDALDLILERFPATFELALCAIIIAVLMGIGFGIWVSIKPNTLKSRLIMAGSLINISLPTFLTGIIFIMVFAVWTNILPPFGRGNTIMIGRWRTGLLTLSGLTHLILPVLTLAMYQLAVLLRLTRSGMREIMGEEFIKTAWAKGLSPARVTYKHALRNVLIPVVTIAGLQFGELIAFSIVTETIFQWPGMGSLLLTSIYESDQPVIVTYIMLASVVIILINILVDILYAFLNPKIRYE
jgi:ABC-type dipeptide/oligopeptide/nickel transport system permease component